MDIIARVAAVVISVLAIDYLVTWIFTMRYPHDEITSALIPFQNHYLATTDAFLASEGVVTEFSIDPGVTTRFLSMSILPCVGLFVLGIIVAFVPFFMKLLNYFWYAIGVALLAVMIQSMFLPPVKTVFDRERKVMVVQHRDWGFLQTAKEVPFEQITGFTYEIERTNSNHVHEDIAYADLYATTAAGKIFIGENQLAQYSEANTYSPSAAMVREIESTTRALTRLIGK